MIKYKSRKPKDEEQDMEGADAHPSLSTAMAVKRNVKKMAYGGSAQRQDGAPSTPARKSDNMRPPESEYMANHFAEGGMAGDCSNCGHPFNRNPGTPAAKPDNMRPPESEFMADHFAEGGIAKSIMSKKRMASGGMVDINENAQESGQTPYDEDNSEAYMKELYSDDQLSPQPMDSNEHSDDIDGDDDFSISSAVRKKMKSR